MAAKRKADEVSVEPSSLDCSICQEVMGSEEVVLVCTHSYHLDCISRWFTGARVMTCPMCRARVDLTHPALAPVRRVVFAEEEQQAEERVREIEGLQRVHELEMQLLEFNTTVEERPRLHHAGGSFQDRYFLSVARQRERRILNDLETVSRDAQSLYEDAEVARGDPAYLAFLRARYIWAYCRMVRFARNPDTASDPAHANYVHLEEDFVYIPPAAGPAHVPEPAQVPEPAAPAGPAHVPEPAQVPQPAAPADPAAPAYFPLPPLRTPDVIDLSTLYDEE